MNKKDDGIGEKVKKYFFLLLILSVSFGIFHNFVLISGGSLPDPAKDYRLSSHVYQNESALSSINEIYVRINESAVRSQFISLCKNYYSGCNLTVPVKFFRAEDLISGGFNEIICVNIKPQNPENSLELLKISSKSLWYNPIVFSPTDFKVISRYPLVTNPSLDGNFPRMILFVKNGQEENREIGVAVCERYIVFAPVAIFEKMGIVL